MQSAISAIECGPVRSRARNIREIANKSEILSFDEIIFQQFGALQVLFLPLWVRKSVKCSVVQQQKSNSFPFSVHWMLRCDRTMGRHETEVYWDISRWMHS